MTAQELASHLSTLQLSHAEAAQLLSISSRTLRRWLEGDDIPGPAEAAIRAWRKLQKYHLPWKPDSVSIFQDDQEQIRLIRTYDQELAAMLERVNKRGGAKNVWSVSISNGNATFGALRVSFYKLMNGSFSLSTYTRKDMDPNVTRDMMLIEDAAYCIAKAFGEARDSNKALKAAAQYARNHSSLFVRDGPKLLDQKEVDRRRRLIETQADKIDELADSALAGLAKYDQFEAILEEIHAVGFYFENSLYSDVARTMA